MSVVLCGQVKRKYLTDSFLSRAVASRTLHQMIENDILSEKKTPRAKMVRLNMPHAQKILNTTETLSDFYKQQSDNHNFKMSPPSLGRKKERLSRLSLKILNEGLELNGAKLTLKEKQSQKKVPEGCLLKRKDPNLSSLNPYGDPNTESKEAGEIIKILRDTEIYNDNYIQNKVYSERIKSITPKQKGFYTSSEVKRHHIDVSKENVPTLNINSSKSYGHLYGEYNSYGLYYIDSENEKFTDAVERRYRNYLENTYLMLYGPERYDLRKKRSPKGECIVIYENSDIILKLINAHTAANSKKISPASIYSKCYCINIAEDTINPFLKADWEKERLRELFTISEIEQADKDLLPWCDAIIQNNPAIELVSKDINKIIETKKLLKLNAENKLIILCKKEEKEFIEEIYKEVNGQIEIKGV